MKQQEKYSVKPALAAVLLGTLLLSACGGGSGGSPSAPAAPALSETQLTYESFALASNGGLFDLEGGLDIYTTPSGTSALSPASSFYTEQISIPKSPSTGAQPLTDTIASVASTLTAPTDLPGTRYMVAGSVFAMASPATGQVTYPVGSNAVQTTYFASGSIQPVFTTLQTSYTVTLLSGLISNSPEELLTTSDLATLTQSVNGLTLYNPAATWQAGSAYIKVVRQVVGDTLLVDDCAAPATTGAILTPCSSSITTLENFFPAVSPVDGKTYTLADGQISTVAGVRAWVANTPVASAATTAYAVFYQGSGGIYEGALLKDGTTQQYFSSGSSTPVNFKVLLNSTAVSSIKAAITF
ncbi:hypothetical protein [Paraburkholderia sp. DHOC27]|uniref:hypothetical protein n=1 Tax=Paraburkholderia sp. DHOC27 TaxID=2303330 RepID=UPI000E3EAA0A|nr:hypothetical protein [Paraburkholderia sp. DHOC27]RFU46668.1 hypothetical protein D0B32_16800 [Paraburkholderia sp. DHOC27]